MFGASHFQKDWGKNIVFWVSYSRNKFLTTNFDKWLQDLMDLQMDHIKLINEKWLQIDWLMTTNLTIWQKKKMTKWLQIDQKIWLNDYKLDYWLQIDYLTKKITNDYRLTNWPKLD